MSSVSVSSFFSRRNVTCAAVAGGTSVNICEGFFHGFLFPLYCRSGHSCARLFVVSLQVLWLSLCFNLVVGWFAFKITEIKFKVLLLQIVAVLSNFKTLLFNE